MRISITILILGFLSPMLQAQVGIGTISPEQELHVAGENSTIRFDYFNSVNSAYNDGTKNVPVFVDGNGDLRLGAIGNSSSELPLNFLIEEYNFIPNDPYNVGDQTGKVVNNIIGESYTEAPIQEVIFDVPIDALIEVKYGITIRVKGSDLSIGPPYSDLTYDQSVKIGLFFLVDINDDGLDASEFDKRYGYNGQYYETQYGGIDGFTYMNTQGYLTLPSGTHSIHFYGVVEDPIANYTSVGYGGQKDYLKIRVYN